MELEHFEIRMNLLLSAEEQNRNWCIGVSSLLAPFKEVISLHSNVTHGHLDHGDANTVIRRMARKS